MKVCLISKYPPIEGGISSSTYWLAKGLGEKGHEVHIVTNALEVENEFREDIEIEDPDYSPINVHVHSTDPSPTVEANPSHIPFSKMFSEKLASLAIQSIEEYDIDIIDSWYLLPYCVSGYIAKSFTDVPQVIRHAGSDLHRLYPSPYLNRLLAEVIKSADAIITNDAEMDFFRNMDIPQSKIVSMQRAPVNMQVFNPDAIPSDLSPYIADKKYFTGIPIITYIGKITYHFETKGLCELIDACSNIVDDFLLLFVANGNKINEFKQLVADANLSDKSVFLNFVPPWQIPSILKASTIVVALDKETSPIMGFHTPMVPAEALATGRCVLMSEPLHEKYPYHHLKNMRDVLVVDPNDSANIKEILEMLLGDLDTIRTIGENGYRAMLNQDLFDEYVDDTIELYKSLL